MQMSPYSSFAFAGLFLSSPPLFARIVVLCLVVALGVVSLVAAFRQKRFHWRGGGLMPTWLGRTMCLLTGLFLLWAALLFWKW